MAEMEKEYMGGGRAKLWTYFIGAIAVLVIALVANFALSNPETAKHGVKSFLGMPGWAFPIVTGVIGVLVYWMGLKIETDWPEAIGAFLIAGSVCTAEIMIGWKKFALGGMAVVPYIIPFVVFLLLLMYGMTKSK